LLQVRLLLLLLLLLFKRQPLLLLRRLRRHVPPAACGLHVLWMLQLCCTSLREPINAAKLLHHRFAAAVNIPAAAATACTLQLLVSCNYTGLLLLLLLLQRRSQLCWRLILVPPASVCWPLMRGLC
jgi:hypothetical protein